MISYGDKQRAKRIFILILIFALIGAIIFFISKSTYKRQNNLENNCIEYYEKCVCIGILSGESIKISFKPNEEEKTFSCEGFEHCWNINETVCP